MLHGDYPDVSLRKKKQKVIDACKRSEQHGIEYAEDLFTVVGLHVNNENLSYGTAVLCLFMQDRIDRYTLFECVRILASYEHELIRDFVEGDPLKSTKSGVLAFSGLYEIQYRPGYIETITDEWDGDAILEEMSGRKFVKGSALEFHVNAVGKALILACNKDHG